MWETWVWSLDQKDPLGKAMATHSVHGIPEEPGGLQTMGSQRVWQDWTTNTLTFTLQKAEFKGTVFVSTDFEMSHINSIYFECPTPQAKCKIDGWSTKVNRFWLNTKMEILGSRLSIGEIIITMVILMMMIMSANALTTHAGILSTSYSRSSAWYQ